MEAFEKLGTIYQSALKEVISTTSSIDLQIKPQESDYGFGEIVGVMYLNGEKSGMLFVSATENDVRILCSHIIGVPISDITSDELDDTMCELVNMTAGSAKLRLSDTEFMFSLSQPFVIKGKDVSIVTKKIAQVVSGTLSNGNISVKIKVMYQ